MLKAIPGKLHLAFDRSLHKKAHTVWFHLYEVLKLAKLGIDLKNQNRGCL